MDDDHEATEPQAGRQEAVDGLEERLRGIETRPLASRAEAFSYLHDDLRDVLEGATDGPSTEPR